MSLSITDQIAKLGSGPLTESGLREHIWPLFSRAIERDRAVGQIYLANHSLGRPLDQVAFDVQEGLDLWYSRMDDVWEDDAWPSEILRFRANVAKLIGLSYPNGVISKTSAGQGLRAVLNALPLDRQLRVVATRGEFDSIDFILKVYAEKGRISVRWVEPMTDDGLFDSQSILDAIEPGVDLVMISHVVFATGQILSVLHEAIHRAHEVGALVMIDAYHSAGVFPVQMEAMNADFMIGGSYKYARGGPGACWLAIHPRHLHGEFRTLDTGWFAKKRPFSYERPDYPERAEGGDAWLESTPQVLSMYQARAGIEFTLAIGVERLRDYNLHQRKILADALESKGVRCYASNDSNEYGAFVPVKDASPFELSAKLRNLGVNTDARTSFVRFGPDLMNSDDELIRAANLTGAAIAGKVGV